MKPCPKCNGTGIIPEHDSPANHGEDGECVSCPVQAPCDICQMTGQVSDEYQEAMDRKVLDNNGLPF